MFYGYDKLQQGRFKEAQAEMKAIRLAQSVKAAAHKSRSRRSPSLLLATLTRFIAF